jgi:hypothetical protein
MLITHNFPELGTNLVTALTTLHVKDLSHCRLCKNQNYYQSAPHNFTANKSYNSNEGKVNKIKYNRSITHKYSFKKKTHELLYAHYEEVKMAIK